MHQDGSAYGLWFLVVINSAIFIIFAFSFYHPKTKRDWRTFGGFSAFVIALFTEMYGFPLTIYLLSGWLESKFPKLNVFSHDAGHLWHTVFGMKGDAHFDVFHIASYVFILGGFFLLSSAWSVLFKAQKVGALATTGPYKHIRHPQYVAFILVMFGFLLQWPTLLTLVMFPILVYFYIRLASSEEREALKDFGDIYKSYMKTVPAFFPHLSQLWAKRS